MTLENKTIPLRGMRAMIADKMVDSLKTAAQLTHFANADASALLTEKKRFGDEGVKVSIEDLLMLCVVQALKKHPEINGCIEDREVHLSDTVDLCAAIALPGNLLVAPAIFKASTMDVSQLRTARQDLATRAKANKLSVTEMTSGTFTISNLGLTRVEHFTPIINTPQIAILGIGRTTDRAVYSKDGDIELRPHVGLSLTFDHRAIDGGPAGDVLTTICHEIENLGK